jgi:hypothetical protein
MKKALASMALLAALFSIVPQAHARRAICAAFERLWGDQEALDAASDEQIDIWVSNYNRWC